MHLINAQDIALNSFNPILKYQHVALVWEQNAAPVIFAWVSPGFPQLAHC